MSQKEKIVSLLRVNGIMTQGELAEAIYGDKLHTPNIYSALMSLVGSNRISDQEHTPHNIPSVIYIFLNKKKLKEPVS